MRFIQILRSVMAERTCSVKLYLLVLLHKIMLYFVLQNLSADYKKALSRCCGEVQWLLLARNSVKASHSFWHSCVLLVQMLFV